MQPGVEAPTQAELEAWNAQLKEIGEEYRALMGDLLERIVPSDAAGSVYGDMRESFQAAAEALMGNPPQLWQAQAQLMQDQFQLWQHGLRALAGESVEPLVTPGRGDRRFKDEAWTRSEEHTSELQSRPHLVCRLLLEKKKK